MKKKSAAFVFCVVASLSPLALYADSTTDASSTQITILRTLVATLTAELQALLAARAGARTVSVSTSYLFTANLPLGSEGSDVSALQQILKDQGFYTYPSITGYFGPATARAVAAFQRAHGLESVDYVGPKTRAILNALASSTSGSTLQIATSSSSVIGSITSGGGGGGYGGGGGGGSGGGGGGSDQTPPSVSITTPTADSTISGSVTLAASANDNVAVANVQFQIDGINLGSAITLPPYSLIWSSASTTDGSHTITTIATDTSGNTASASVRVTMSQARKITFMEGGIKKLFPGDGVIVGWVFDRENPTRTVAVNFYVDRIAMDTSGVGGYDASGALAGSMQAQAINKQVNWTYSIDGNHGFSFRIPDKWRDGAVHTLYVQPVTFYGTVSPPIGDKNGYPFILPAATAVHSPPVVDAHCLEADSRCPSVGNDYLAPNYATAMGWSDGKNYFNEWGCTSPTGMDTIARLNIIPLGTYGPHFQKDSLGADWYHGTSDGPMPIVYFDLARIDHGSRWSMKQTLYNKANNKWEIYSVLDNPESDGGVSSRDGRGRYIVMNDYSLPGWGPSSPIPGSENKIPGVSDVSANTDIPSYPLVGTGPLGITAMTNTLYQPTTRGTTVMGKTCIHMNPKLLDYDAQDRPQTLIVNLWHDTKSEACQLPSGAPIQRLPYPGNYLYRFRGPELGWQLDLAAGLVTDSLYNITSNKPARTPTLVAGTAHMLVTANSDGVVYTIDLDKPKANNASVLLDCRAGKKAIFGQATAAQDGRVLFKGEKSDIAVERKTYGLGNDVFPAEIYYAFRHGDDRSGSGK